MRIEVVPLRARSVDEQRDGVVVGKRRQLENALAVDAQLFARRGDDGKVGNAIEQRRQRRRELGGEMLDVVQQQERRLASEQCVGERGDVRRAGA